MMFSLKYDKMYGVAIQVSTLIPEGDVRVPVEQQDSGDIKIVYRRIIREIDWPKADQVEKLNHSIAADIRYIEQLERYYRGTATAKDITALAARQGQQLIDEVTSTTVEHLPAVNDDVHELMMRAYVAGFSNGEPSTGLFPDPETDDSHAAKVVQAIRRAYPELPS